MSAPTTPTYDRPNKGALERIYITYKARIVAESRMLRLAFWSQVLVAWYSIAIIVVSLADISTVYKVTDGGVATTSLSILVLTASVFFYSQRFEIRAAGFRECYLKLRELYDSDESPEIVLKKYHDVLNAFENHSNFDYDSVLLASRVSKKKLQDANGDIDFGGWAMTLHIAKVILNYLIFSVLASIPIFMFFATIKPEI